MSEVLGTRLLYSVREVAAMLGISRGMVYKLIDQNLLSRPLKVGAASRWTREAVDQCIKALSRSVSDHRVTT